GWALAEETVDYMNPKEFEVGLTPTARPAGIPEGALLAIRKDFNCFTTRGTWPEGPKWSQVFRRLSYDEETGELIFDDKIHDSMSFDEIHKQFEPMVHKMETHFWYVPEAVDGILVRSPTRVRNPTKSEIEEHEAQNHAVYRNWCEVCIKARSTGTPHRKRTEEEKKEEGPAVHSDFYFMQSSPFLAMKSTPSGMLGAFALPDKSNSGFTQRGMARFITETGHKRLVHMSDNEPALMALKTSVSASLPDIEIVNKNSPVGDHQANGSIEVAIRKLKRQMRALRLSLERKLNMSLPNDHPLTSWIANFAAESINVYRKDSSGSTAYERAYGKKWNKPALEFGELVHIREAKEKAGRLDWEPMSTPVRFVGHHARTNSVMGLSSEGLKIGLAVKRLPTNQRWSTDGIEELAGFPWDLASRTGVREGTHLRPALPSVGRARLAPPTPDLPPDARAFYVRKADVERHGFTDNCKGCAAVKAGARPVAHSDECRRRIVALVGPRRVELRADRVALRSEQKEEELKKRADAEAERLRKGDEKSSAAPKKKVRIEEKFEKEGAKRSEPSSPESPSKRWKSVGHMQYKRAAEVAVEELDPSASKAEEAEVVVPSEPPVVAVGAGDTAIEQVLARGEAGSSSAAASGSTAAHKKQDPAHDISYLGFDYEEEVMSERKWRRVESIDCLKRKIEAKKQELGAVDVAEIFSPPRFTRGASHLGLNAGFAVDLETGWDLDIPEHMKQLKELIEVQDPFMLTGSPRCDPFSVLQNLNKYYLDNAKNREALERGERHLCLSIDLYEERCTFSMSTPLEQSHGIIREWRLQSCWTGIAQTGLVDLCHRHISLIGGLGHLCAKYPDELVYTVLQGIKNQMMVDGCLNSIQAYSSGPDPTEPLFPEEFQEEVEQFYDDISGEQLPPKLVQEARAEEIGWIHKIGLYDKVPRSQAVASGKPILPVRWVDVNKGDKAHYKVRSRIVGKELKAKTKEALLAHELFSATPPWEMVKALFSLLVTDFEKQDKELVMGVFDISRAHFMPKVLRELYVEIPEEDKKPEEGDIVGRLNRGMYGFRDASHAWMLDWQELLRGGGYRVGAANPALFYNAEECSRGAVHGDDFYVLGPVEAVDKVKELLGSKYQMRESHRLGFTTGCVQEATVLNRVVRLGTTDGRRWVRIEPDKRHVELIVQGV
ncbi:Reverse transcriptase Ty1/copia-type domain-containing protein, partial [Durusdinium trenchii]